ncbi:holo-[acyl-carrier-protein] synthase [Enterococcus sp. 10A9_DIV0425]|uniref:Holo-[acyl-carrier-protein] synthase n=1 Tax=Candidatus Enterococcus wittei TaxID=1987383 RepID=A0A242K008_9ENTE|nr:holo-ACP synthase [Enterococcus sp. 10A9_DIV0425]OTP10991.1 holo-[acyl-carrier-protein] synthase [Enterococcus sp. 10A9_DIV0425]THE16244.1 holo-ACP synthase [Enterococcus hirae]
MITGIGIDAVELSRIAKIIKEKTSFIDRVLTPSEIEMFRRLPFHRQVEFLGGRYACKEAFSKAWGTGIGKVTFQEIEILKNEAGQPIVTKSPHQGKIWVSITHTDELAFAQIILED